MKPNRAIPRFSPFSHVRRFLGRTLFDSNATRTGRRSVPKWLPTVEPLEDRCLLAVSSVFSSGLLSITSNADDDIEVLVESGNVKINGQNPVGGVLAASAVQEILVTGGPGANSIDVSGVTRALFGALDNKVTIDGGAGNDLIVGSEFADRLAGGEGDDTLVGGAGGDTYLFARTGYEVLGNDRIVEAKGNGNDTLDFSAMGAAIQVDLSRTDLQTVTAGVLSIQIAGEAEPSIENALGANGYADSLVGSAGANLLDGGSGDDTLTGGAGDDTLFGGAGNDSIAGGGGNDWYRFDNAPGQALGTDTVVEAANLDSDTLDFSGQQQAVTVSLAASGQQTINSLLALTVSTSGIENVVGTGLGDSLTGDARGNRIDGGAEADSLFGQDGADTLVGGDGADSLTGGSGADVLFVGLGAGDTVVDASAEDQVFDSFDRPDSTGSLWTTPGASIEGGRIKASSGFLATLNASAALSSGTVRAEVDLSASVDGTNVLAVVLVARYQANSGYYEGRITKTAAGLGASIVRWSFTGGSWQATILATAPADDARLANTGTLEFAVDAVPNAGNRLALFFDGRLIAVAADGNITAAGAAGLRVETSGPVAWIDNFSATGRAPASAPWTGSRPAFYDDFAGIYAPTLSARDWNDPYGKLTIQNGYAVPTGIVGDGYALVRDVIPSEARIQVAVDMRGEVNAVVGLIARYSGSTPSSENFYLMSLHKETGNKYFVSFFECRNGSYAQFPLNGPDPQLPLTLSVDVDGTGILSLAVSEFSGGTNFLLSLDEQVLISYTDPRSNRITGAGQVGLKLTYPAPVASDFQVTPLAAASWPGTTLTFSGDFDGNGRSEVIGRVAATGDWWIASSPTTVRYAGNWSTTTTWTDDILVGDFNGDRRADLAGRDSATGQWTVGISDGARLDMRQWASDTAGWQDVRVGDFNGDGRDDLVGRTASGAVRVAVSTGTDFVISTWAQWAVPSGYAWVNVTVADLNGDGRDDLGVQNSVSATWDFWLSDSTYFVSSGSLPTTIPTTGAVIRTGDFDGDGMEEILAAIPTPNGDEWALLGYSGGGVFVVSSFGNAHIGESGLVVGDVNQDGKADLYARSSGAWVVALSNGQTFLGNDWGTWFDNWSWTGLGREVVDPSAPLEAVTKAFAEVYNNVEVQLYRGFMKGAQATEETRAGNSWDQSLLLATKLEALGIETRVRVGTLNYSTIDIANWTGAETILSAKAMLGEVGLAGTGDNVMHYARVEAWLPGLPGTNTLAYQPLNPALKSMSYAARIPGYAPLAWGDSEEESLRREYLSLNPDADTRLPSEYYEQAVQDHIKALGDAAGTRYSLGDVPYDGSIQQRQFATIQDVYVVGPGSFTPTETIDNLAVLPATQSHRVRLVVKKGVETLLVQTLTVPMVSLSRISLSYTPSGTNFKPILSVVGDNPLANLQITGNPTNSTPVTLTVDHFNPGETTASESRTYTRGVGKHLAVSLDAWQYSEERLATMRASLNSAALSQYGVESPNPGAPLISSALSLMGAKYFYEIARSADIISGLTNTRQVHPRVGSGIVAGGPSVNDTDAPSVIYDWTLQNPVIPTEMFIDAKNIVVAPCRINVMNVGDEYFAYDTMRLCSDTASALEHYILEEMTNTPSISTVKGLQRAASLGQEVEYMLGSSSSATIDSQMAQVQHLTADEKGTLKNTLLADPANRLVIPALQTSVEDYTGSVYYQFTRDGTGYRWEYIITLGNLETNGGAPTASTPNTNVPPPSAPGQASAFDPVNVANGNMYRDETDILLPNPGMPLEFSRHYDSQATYDPEADTGGRDWGMGEGWLHTYSDRLVLLADGYVEWTTNQGFKYKFTPSGGGSFISPNGLFGTLTLAGVIYTYQEKNGLKRMFQSVDGVYRLVELRDRNDHALSVVYAGGNIDHVRSAADPSRRLTFTYAGNRIASVADHTGRQWNYNYKSMVDPDGNTRYYLAEALQPRSPGQPGAAVSYGYIEGGRLHGLMNRITEPDGGGHTYSYFANRRAASVTDANGHTTHTYYDLFHNLTQTVNERGVREEYQYDGTTGMLKRKVHQDRTRDSYTYNNHLLMTSWTDASGNKETYLFQTNTDNLDSSTDRAGITTSYTYTAFANVDKITRPSDRITDFDYDAQGNLIQAKDAEGNISTYTYYTYSDGRPNGLVKTQVEARATETEFGGTAGFTTEYTYSAAGQLLTSNKAGGVVEAANAYDARGFLVSTTNATGISMRSTHDTLGRRLSQALPDPDGAAGPLAAIVTRAEYDKLGRMVAAFDALGRKTAYTYDKKGQLVRVTYADGTYEEYAYDGAMNRTSATDEKGRVTRFIYDSQNRLIQTILPNGDTRRVRYDFEGKAIETIDGNGNRVKTTYDQAGRVKAIAQPRDLVTKFDYYGLTDAMAGNLMKKTEGFGTTFAALASESYEYDKLDRLVKTTVRQEVAQSDESITTMTYDKGGNVVAVAAYDIAGLAAVPPNLDDITEQARIRKTTTKFDNFGRVVEVKDAEDKVAATSYLADGRVNSTTDKRGSVTNFGYDLAGRRTSVTLAAAHPWEDRAVIGTSYDAAGNVVATTDPLGRVTAFAYDLRNRQTAVTGAVGRIDATSRTTFDAAGQVVATIDAVGRLAGYSRRDLNGRIVRRIGADPDNSGGYLAPETTYAYDANGNTLTVTDSLGRVTSYQYDSLNRVTQVDEPKPDLLPAGQGLPARRVINTYNTKGQLEKVEEQFGTQSGAPTRIIASYLHDDLGRVTRETATDPDGPAAGALPAPYVQNAYSGFGDVKTATDQVGRITEYGYDRMGRTTSVTLAAPDPNSPDDRPETTTKYDGAGNVLEVTERVKPLGGGGGGSFETRKTDYAYDALGRQTSVTSPDPDGAVGSTPRSVHGYAYDLAGNLVQETDPLGFVTRYAFDALNRRVSVRTPDPNGSAGGSGSGQHRAETVHLYNAAGECVAIVDPSGNRTDYGYDRLGRKTSETVQDPDHGTLTESFVYDAGGNLTESKDRLGRTRTFIYDRLDRLTNESWTDGAGALHQIIDVYDTFGRRQETKEVSGSSGATTLSRYVYAYDDLDRLKSQSNQGTWSDLFVKNDYTYNSAGQLTQDLETITRGQAVTQSQITYTSDNLDRVTVIEQLPIGTAITATRKQVQFTYNLLGEVTAIDRRNQASGVWQDVVHSDLARDQAGRLVDLVHKKGTTTFADYDYYFDLASQITRMVSKDDGTLGVGYAPDGQVTHAALLGPESFASAVTYTTGNHTSSVRLGDVNGDGKLDLVSANAASNSIVVNLGVGDGTFQATPASSVNFTFVMDLGIADLNGDGKLDILAVAHQFANNARVYFGDGAGGYSAANSVLLPSAGWLPIAMTLADLNQDGKLDLMTANYSGGSVSVMLGVGNGTFGAATNYAVGPEPMGVSAGDVNSDGFIDIVATVPSQSRVMVLLGNGAGSFAAGIPYTTGAIPSDVIVIDATGDGRADILTANLGGTASLLKQQADGTLAPKVEITVGSTPFALTVADMDQDGIADLVTANQYVDTVSVLKGLGGGAFSAAVQYSVRQQAGTYRPFAVTTGDLNADGNADVVVANWLADDAVSEPFNVSVLLRKSPSVENFRYDAGGVRSGAGSGGAYTPGDNNELDSDGKYTYQYDRLGNLSLRTETATGKVTEYAWDIHNRLTMVTYRVSAGGAVTGTAEYGYDMNGRRIRRKVDLDGQAGFEIDERFGYDHKPAGPQAGAQGNLALVFDATGSLKNRYLSADAVDAALAEDDFSGSGTANATEWLLADHEGSVRDIVRETGSEVTHVSYDSFGNMTAVTGTAPVAPRIGYTGQERDPETGLWYYGARYYDPKTGRFLSQDPTGYGAGDANLYRYVHNSPVIYVDPTGLRLFSPVQQAFNAVSNTIGNAFNSWGNSLSNFGSAVSQVFAPAAQAVQSSFASYSLRSVVGMGNRSLDFGAVPMPSFTGNLGAPAAMPNMGISEIIGGWNAPAAAPIPMGPQQGFWESTFEDVNNAVNGGVTLFGQEFHVPWSPNAGGFSESVNAYGNAVVVAGAGTASGAATGAAAGGATGAVAGAFFGGVGAAPGAAAGATAGAISGGIGGFIGSIFASDAGSAAKTGAISGAIAGPFAGASAVVSKGLAAAEEAAAAASSVPGTTARMPGGPFTGFPEWGRSTVGWGRGASGAVSRTAQITAEEARLLDPAKVREAKAFYEGIYKENPANLAAQARTQLMDRILQHIGGQ